MWGTAAPTAMFAGQLNELIDLSDRKGKEGKTMLILGKGKGLGGQVWALADQVV